MKIPETTDGLTIGSRLWVFDENVRVYRKGGGGPIYEEHFVPYYIIGENRVSWIVSQYPDLGLDSHLAVKINKKTLQENADGWRHRCFYTDQGREEKTWVDRHRYKLIHELEGCRDVILLQKIAQLIGYTPADPKTVESSPKE
jgi:hypothetical protein